MDKNNFEGFDSPRQNWVKFPGDWTDITKRITNIAVLKVVEYVLRHTWGYSEYGITKKLTVDEFVNGRKRKDGTRIDKGTGLSESSVKRGIAKAVEDGFLEVEVDESDLGRVKRYFALKMRPSVQGVQLDTPGGPTLTPRGVNLAPPSEIDTSDRYSRYSDNSISEEKYAKLKAEVYKKVGKSIK